MAAKKRPTQHSTPPRTGNPWKARKGKLSGGIIAVSSAAIVAIYSLGRANTSAGSEQHFVDAPTVALTAQASTGSAPATVGYKDGSYRGSGTSRHGGMEVTVVIKDGRIVAANVTTCSTHYPCSDVDSLVKATVSKQLVPTNHVSGASDSSKAYKQALTSALKLAAA